jgi:hypothetical protein
MRVVCEGVETMAAPGTGMALKSSFFNRAWTMTTQ